MSIAAAIGLSAGSSILGANKAGKAAKQAANSQIDLANQRYEAARSDTQPYRDIGSGATYTLANVLKIPGVTMPTSISDADQEKLKALTPQGLIEQDPGYLFRLGEGQKALERSQIAGQVTGGARIKAALRYNQGVASQEFGNVMDRYFRLSGIGQNAVNTMTSAGNTTGQMQADAYGNAGAADASRYQGMNQAVQSGVGNYATLQQYNDWKKMMETN